MRFAGFLLLWGGFLGGSFASVFRLEQGGDKWSTIPWGWYALSIAFGIVGVVLLRRARREESEDETQTEAEYSAVVRSLKTLRIQVEELVQKNPLPGEVLRAIDGSCSDQIAEFVAARQSLAKRFGLLVYAEVMTEFASAERLINRSWSAAADGYVDEVASSLRRAKQHLTKADELLSAADTA